MSDINIRELTTAAEEGHGCAVSSALQSVDFIEAMKVLKQIAEQNVKDTDNDASQTHLWVKANSQDSLASAKLLARTPEEFFLSSRVSRIYRICYCRLWYPTLW